MTEQTTAPEGSKTTHPIIKLKGEARTEFKDWLAVEEPLEIRLGYMDAREGRRHRSLSITMRTPGNDAELAAGFLYGEGIITAPDQVETIDSDRENVVRVELKPGLSLDLSRLERHFYTTSSCGVCGKASLEALSINGARVLLDNDFTVPAATLHRIGENLRAHQGLFRDTGGNHATAVFDREGGIRLAREDVGRHNAMDKLVGRLFLDGNLPLTERGLMVSGRASFELMQKALMAGCPMLVAVGAPSSLAVELAEEYNITLVGFLQKAGFNIYHGASRIL